MVVYWVLRRAGDAPARQFGHVGALRVAVDGRCSLSCGWRCAARRILT